MNESLFLKNPEWVDEAVERIVSEMMKSAKIHLRNYGRKEISWVST